jgi:hypothetical protein
MRAFRIVAVTLMLLFPACSRGAAAEVLKLERGLLTVNGRAGENGSIGSG